MPYTNPQRLARAAAALVCVLMLVDCGGGKPSRPAPSTPAVDAAAATFGAIHPLVHLAGIVAPYQNVALQSSLTEPTDQVYVQEGDRVSRGELLAQLDTSDLQANLQADLATAESDRAATTHNVYQGGLSISQGVDAMQSAQNAVIQAQANLRRDSTDLTRYQKLLASGYVTQQMVEQQQTTVVNDRQALRSAQAQLAAARSTVSANGTMNSSGLQSSTVAQSRATEQVAIAQAQQTRVQIEKARILSPIDGVVVNRNLNPGEYPGTRTIFTLQQVNPIYAVLRGSGTQIASIATGAPVAIVSSDLGGVRLTGHVQGVLNQIEPGSTDFEVKVILDNPADKLRPGMAVEGQVALPAITGIRIPATAFTDDNDDTVMVVDANGTVRTARVRDLGDDGVNAVVAGIQPGARVIADGQTSVGNGEKVSVR
jgi:HlyD family secretion protein